MKHLFPLFVAAWLVTVAVEGFEYWVYTATRFLVCISAIGYSLALAGKRNVLSVLLVITAIIFNPLIPLRLTREIWQNIDIAAALLFVAALPCWVPLAAQMKKERGAILGWIIYGGGIGLLVTLWLLNGIKNRMEVTPDPTAPGEITSRKGLFENENKAADRLTREIYSEPFRKKEPAVNPVPATFPKSLDAAPK